MGETHFSPEEIANIIRDLERGWRGEDYDMLSRNCCSFSNTLCEKLVGQHIPAWVDRLAKIASAAKSGIDGIIDVERIAVNLQLIEESQALSCWSVSQSSETASRRVCDL